MGLDFVADSAGESASDGEPFTTFGSVIASPILTSLSLNHSTLVLCRRGVLLDREFVLMKPRRRDFARVAVEVWW
jgi:hypothetical protein